jgi:predicted phage tail protein
MKIISILLALVNSLTAGLVIALSLSASELRDAAPLWLATKVISGLAVIAISAYLWLGAVRAANVHVTLLAGLLLVMLGTATGIWTLHLAIVTGDMENYMAAYGGSLILQGLAALWSPRQKARDVLAS